MTQRAGETVAQYVERTTYVWPQEGFPLSSRNQEALRAALQRIGVNDTSLMYLQGLFYDVQAIRSTRQKALAGYDHESVKFPDENITEMFRA